MDIQEKIDEINRVWNSKDGLSGQLVELSRELWQLAGDLASAETAEMQLIISLKENAYKMSFAEAEAKARMESGNAKTRLKYQFSALEYLFKAVENRFNLLNVEVFRVEGQSDSPQIADPHKTEPQGPEQSA